MGLMSVRTITEIDLVVGRGEIRNVVYLIKHPWVETLIQQKTYRTRLCGVQWLKNCVCESRDLKFGLRHLLQTFKFAFIFLLQPPTGTDTMVKAGVSTNISTKHQCITAMKEYESKSLEVSKMQYRISA